MTKEKKEALRSRLAEDLVMDALCRETPLLELDSLDVMAITAAADEIAGGSLSFPEVNGMETYGDLEDLIEIKSP